MNRPLTDLNNRHAGLPCYIIGKGPSLDRLQLSDFREGCPVIAINESIKKIERMLPDGEFPLYSMQQDGKRACMRRPRTSTWLLLTDCGNHRQVPEGETDMPCCSQHHYPGHPRRITYAQSRLGIRPDAFSTESAIAVARKMGCSHIILVAHDACVSGDVGYCNSLGPLFYEDRNPQAFPEHARRIAKMLSGTPHSYLTPGAPGNPEPVTVITPTGDRPELMRICRDYVNRQTRFPAQWIVVDDGDIPLPRDLRTGCTYIRREPRDSDPLHTLPVNLLTATQHVRTDRVAIMEDDDWYSPSWLETFVPHLNTFDLVGEGRTVYYHVPSRMHKRCKNNAHASLCQTLFSSNALHTVADVCRQNAERNDYHVDLDLWKSPLPHCLKTPEDPYVVGLKGLPGRRGQTSGHMPSPASYDIDATGAMLAGWIGIDARRYARWMTLPPQRTAQALSCELCETEERILPTELCEILKTTYGLITRIESRDGEPDPETQVYELALSLLRSRLEKEAS